MMESNAFNDAFTTNHGGSCFFVSVDPAFDTQIAEAASLVARSRPAESRNEFTSSLVESARAAQPPAAPPAEDADEEEESKKAAVDTPETVEKKRAVLKELFAALKEGGNKLESVQSDREFEGWSNLVLSLSLSLLEGEDLAAAVETLSATYTTLPSSSSTSASTSASPIPSLPARYTALATLFNALPSTSSTSKLSTLTALVSFASSNDDSAVLAPTLLSLPAIFSALSLSPSAADETVLSIAQALASKGAQSEARKVLESHLSAAKKADGAEKTEQKGKLADLLVALSLSAPDVYDFTPLSSLPSPPSNGDLASLLSIFLRGDLSAFSSLSSSSLPNVGVEGVELKKDQLEKKIKLVKLAELCSERVGETVGYKEIQEVLGLSGGEDEGEEVETWVIDAIRASLLSGRLSQPTQSLSITRALPPSSSGEGKLDAKYWKLIQERLEGWKERVGRVGESARRAAGQANGIQGAGREEKGVKGDEE